MWLGIRGPSGDLVAACDSLNLTVQGDDYADLQAAIYEAIELLFTDLLSEGTDAFLEFLSRHGWVSVTPPPTAPVEDLYFDLPYSVVFGHSSKHLQGAAG